MDISAWTMLDPTVEVGQTKKLFFNQYLFKMVLYAPASRILFHAKTADDIGSLLTKRQAFASIWPPGSRNQIDQADVRQLTFLMDLRRQLGDKIKLRIEEPFCAVYANDEKLLYDISQQDPCKGLRKIYRPENEEATRILNRGDIVSSSRNKFKFKIILRNIRGSKESLYQIQQYIDSQEGTKMPRSCRRFLDSSRFYGDVYFYANDDKIVTFINLIEPGIVSGIYALSPLSE